MLCEYLKVKPELLKFMLKVFKDLEFIYDDQGIIKINKPSKQAIESSHIYQLRQSRMEVENDYCMMTFRILKNG